MRSLGLAIAFLLLGSPAAGLAQEMLHGGTRVFPENSYEDRSVVPIRKDAERAMGDGRWVYVPVTTMPLVGGDARLPIVRGFVRFDLYRYEIYPEGDEPVEYMRELAQGIVDNELLPAARQISEYADRAAQFESIAISIDDELKTAVLVPNQRVLPGETPRITIDYGLNNTLTSVSWLFLQFDYFLANANEGNIEGTYTAWDNFSNTQAFVTASEYLHAREGVRFFDQGVMLALFPRKELSLDERLHFKIYFSNLVRLVVGHEVCHHLLDHPGNPAMPRREQELAADRCSLELFRKVTEALYPPPSEDVRHERSYRAIWELSLISLLIWPLETGDDYPTPVERFASLEADNPLSSFPGVSEDYASSAGAMPLPLPDERVFDARELIVSRVYGPGDLSGMNAKVTQMMMTVEDEVADYCYRYDCLGSLASSDVSLRFASIRALLYLVSAQVELAELEGESSPDLTNTRRLAIRALDASDESMVQTRAALEAIIARIDRQFAKIDTSQIHFGARSVPGNRRPASLSK